MAAASRWSPYLALQTQLDGGSSGETFYYIPLLNFKVKGDIVGAADAVCGGFCAGLMHELSIPHALMWARCCGTLCTQKKGAQSSLPTLDELQATLKMLDFHVGVNEGGKWPLASTKEFARLSRLESYVTQDGMYSAYNPVNDSDITTEVLKSAVDFQGHTFLHLATIFGNLNAVCFFVDKHEALVHQSDRYHVRPLDRAYDYLGKEGDSTHVQAKEILRILFILHILDFVFGDNDISALAAEADAETDMPSPNGGTTVHLRYSSAQILSKLYPSTNKSVLSARDGECCILAQAVDIFC